MASLKVKYNDFQIGDVFTFHKTITETDIAAFAKLVGDFNPMHADDAFAQQQGFEKKIAHGMLLAGLFSTLVGMHCPGKHCLYLSQSAQFRFPAYAGDELVVRGEITAKNDALQILTVQTEICKGAQKLVTGEAKVKVL